MWKQGAASRWDTHAKTLQELDHGGSEVRAHVKITDFGLARHVVDSESLAMTDAGASGDAPLHGSRAMDGPVSRPADGRLCDGRNALSLARRPASV